MACYLTKKESMIKILAIEAEIHKSLPNITRITCMGGGGRDLCENHSHSEFHTMGSLDLDCYTEIPVPTK